MPRWLSRHERPAAKSPGIVAGRAKSGLGTSASSVSERRVVPRAHERAAGAARVAPLDGDARRDRPRPEVRHRVLPFGLGPSAHDEQITGTGSEIVRGAL